MRSRATAHQAGRADRREERGEIHRREQGTQPRLMDNVHPLPRRALQIAFGRLEMNRILDLYGRMVAAGHWRDYAIDLDADAAVFSAFRRAAERPEIRIEKRLHLGHARLRILFDESEDDIVLVLEQSINLADADRCLSGEFGSGRRME